MDKIEIISGKLGIEHRKVANTVKLLEDGATVPFISRYRKEATGSLDEVAIMNISTLLGQLEELDKRRRYILESIEASGALTPELSSRIMACDDATTLEDIYLPFKPKRRTKAEVARNNGLEPLAKIIMAQKSIDIHSQAGRFIGENVPDEDAAIAGASDIIAEWVSENERVRNTIRGLFRRSAVIKSKVVKGKEIEGANYENYFDTEMPLSRANSHRILAMRRGENEGFLKVSITIDDTEAVNKINKIIIHGNNSTTAIIESAISDSYKRLIRPSIENEFASSSKETADKEAIALFASNLRQLLFAAPLGRKRVLGVDPGYRTGCKLVCLDEQGNLLHNDVIYPTPPKSEVKLTAKRVSQLIEAYKIDAIAIGNGTASRETESFFKSLRYSRNVDVYVVSENGASIYSVSKIAREEFPDKDVTVRGAVSIGRRLLDPLAELVKIDPKSIGVGQYQHDVNQTELRNALTFTVESCVNSVGINLNTASKELLTYVSGLGPQLAANIVNYRAENGDFTSREELMNVPRMGKKAYQQCVGFLRIPGAANILDNTAVHPESYGIVESMARDNRCPVEQLVIDKKLRQTIDLSKYISDSVGLPTLNDIMAELEKPGRDPRTEVEVLEFDDNVHTIDDVQEGMVLNGIVTNVTQFGVFVDFGIKENGLVHISEICDKYIASPTEMVSLHQHVKVKVLSVDRNRKRISLTMKGI